MHFIDSDPFICVVIASITTSSSVTSVITRESSVNERLLDTAEKQNKACRYVLHTYSCQVITWDIWHFQDDWKYILYGFKSLVVYYPGWFLGRALQYSYFLPLRSMPWILLAILVLWLGAPMLSTSHSRSVSPGYCNRYFLHTIRKEECIKRINVLLC